jgi:hypothetical protein
MRKAIQDRFVSRFESETYTSPFPALNPRLPIARDTRTGDFQSPANRIGSRAPLLGKLDTATLRTEGIQLSLYFGNGSIFDRPFHGTETARRSGSPDYLFLRISRLQRLKFQLDDQPFIKAGQRT